MGAFLSFFYEHGYVVELVLSCVIFTLYFCRRSWFAARAVLCVGALFALSFLWSFLDSKFSLVIGSFDVLRVGRYITLYAASVAAIFFCFDTPFHIGVFASIAAYGIQHGAYKLGELLCFFIDREMDAVTRPFVYVPVVVALYVAAFFLFRPLFRKLEKEYIGKRQTYLLTIPLILFTMLFQYPPEMSSDYYIVYTCFDILCCFFILYIVANMIRTGRIEQEYRVREHLHYLEKQQYDLSREKFEMLGIKFHDVKHQLLALKNRLSGEELYELERAVTLYDMTVRSGNEVLDVIFTEKSLVCEQKNIRFERIADGEILNFLSASDAYSLLGNMIDNAIEAVSKVAEPAGRVISMMLRESKGMAFLQVENRYTGEVVFEDGLPVTTKSNTLYHGYGMKSIRSIVEKYGGTLNIRAEDGVFRVTVLLPLPKPQD